MNLCAVTVKTYKVGGKFCCTISNVIFLNWDSLYARLNSHYKAWSYKKNKYKKIKTYKKSVWKEPTVKRCLLIPDLKPFRSYVKEKHPIGREFQHLAVQARNC